MNVFFIGALKAQVMIRHALLSFRCWVAGRLWLHLGLMLLLKVIALTFIWHSFIGPNQVKVNSAKMASHLAANAPPKLVSDAQRESPHDR